MLTIKRVEEKQIDLMDLQVGDLISDNGIQFIVISREGEQAIIQQYDHVEDYVFNKDGSNVYKGSDLQKYVQNEYRKQFSEDFLKHCGEFYILTKEMFYENEFLGIPKNRIRYDSNGYGTWYWTASPLVGDGSNVRIISPYGNVSNYGAGSSNGVAPACVVA